MEFTTAKGLGGLGDREYNPATRGVSVSSTSTPTARVLAGIFPRLHLFPHCKAIAGTVDDEGGGEERGLAGSALRCCITRYRLTRDSHFLLDVIRFPIWLFWPISPKRYIPEMLTNVPLRGFMTGNTGKTTVAL